MPAFNGRFRGGRVAGRFETRSAIVPLILITGESNAGGSAVNANASGAELAARSSVQILNNTTLVWQDLDVGTNNLIGHTGYTDNATHGIEIGLANTIEAGRWGNGRTYLIKAGQGSSTIAQWAEGNGSGYLTTLRTRVAAAKALLAASKTRYAPIILYSQGINDASAGTNVQTWKAATIAHFANLRAEIGSNARIFMTAFEGPNMTARATFNTAMAEIAAADSLVTVLSTADLVVVDANHWSYEGFLVLAERLADELAGGLGTLATPVADPVGSGSVTPGQQVSISGPSGATIRYTTNGETPSSHSLPYTSPITISTSTTIKAIATRRGYRNAAVMSETYGTAAQWTTWGSLSNATQVGDYIQNNGSTPSGGLGSLSIDSTQAFSVVIELSATQSVTDGIVVFLDSVNTANYTWNVANNYLLGMFHTGGQQYKTLGATTSSALGAVVLNSLLRMRKSGNDIVMERSVDAGVNWSTLGTETGILTGQTTLYLKAMFTTGGASKKIRTKIEI